MTKLNQIQSTLSRELRQLNDMIAQSLLCGNSLMNEIVAGYLRHKGKQLRPLLVLLSGRFFGDINDAVLRGAAAVEMLHNASLIHDDVIDRARERRGAPTINSVWDNHVAVLVGDYFVTNALRCAVATGDSRILDALAGMGSDLALGEIDQIDNARRHDIDEDTYLDIIGKKTASLFECCVTVGAYAAGATRVQMEPLCRYARLLGVCFQIKDDTFDYYDDPSVGKPTGNDLREGKITLPLIHALQRDDHPEAEAMRSLARNDQLDDAQINRLVEFAKRAGGIDYAYATMRRLRDDAVRQLQVYRPNDRVDDFEQLFDFIIERSL